MILYNILAISILFNITLVWYARLLLRQLNIKDAEKTKEGENKL